MKKIIKTDLGDMVAIASDTALHFFDFTDSKFASERIARFAQENFPKKNDAAKKILSDTEQQIDEYFAGTRKKFALPLAYAGTEFQRSVWQALQKIPYGTTKSYQELATKMGRPKSCRAVASATGKNYFAIIIPCHRLINTSGALGGYAGGLERKLALLELEKNS